MSGSRRLDSTAARFGPGAVEDWIWRGTPPHEQEGPRSHGRWPNGSSNRGVNRSTWISLFTRLTALRPRRSRRPLHKDSLHDEGL